MARITPYVELVGQERIAPTVELPPRPGVGRPSDGRPIDEVRAQARDDVYWVPLAPRLLQELARLPEPDAELRGHMEAGAVAVDVTHLRGAPADARVRIGCVMTFTVEETQLLEL